MAIVWYLVLIIYNVKKLFRANVSAHCLFLIHKIRKLYDWVFHTVILSHSIQIKSRVDLAFLCWGTFSRVKEPGPEVDYSPPTSTKAVNKWNYTCIPSCVLNHAQGPLCFLPNNFSKIKQLGIFSLASAASWWNTYLWYISKNNNKTSLLEEPH